MNQLEIKEAPIEEAVKVNATIVEFDEAYPKEYFEERCIGKEHLIIVAYREWEAAGYLVWYDRYQDGSFYCRMAWVDPDFRKKWILTSLMTYQSDRAKKKWYTKIKIKTRNRRREMLSFLVKEGYVFTDVIPQGDILDNGILLEKNI